MGVVSSPPSLAYFQDLALSVEEYKYSKMILDLRAIENRTRKAHSHLIRVRAWFGIRHLALSICHVTVSLSCRFLWTP
jgi:hypothetical protein